MFDKQRKITFLTKDGTTTTTNKQYSTEKKKRSSTSRLEKLWDARRRG